MIKSYRNLSESKIRVVLILVIRQKYLSYSAGLLYEQEKKAIVYTIT